MVDTPRSTPSPEELRRRLTPEQWHVTQEAGTERPFTGEYWNVWDDGKYHCVVCDAALFDADTKFDAGCGWPSFYQPLDTDAVTYLEDRTYGMVRTEVRCATCGAHLGHVFPDGPAPTGDRFCMNSASLRLLPEAGRTAGEPAVTGAEPTEGSDA